MAVVAVVVAVVAVVWMLITYADLFWKFNEEVKRASNIVLVSFIKLSALPHIHHLLLLLLLLLLLFSFSLSLSIHSSEIDINFNSINRPPEKSAPVAAGFEPIKSILTRLTSFINWHANECGFGSDKMNRSQQENEH